MSVLIILLTLNLILFLGCIKILLISGVPVEKVYGMYRKYRISLSLIMTGSLLSHS